MGSKRPFIPPIDHSPVGTLVRTIIPFVLRYVLNGMYVKIDPEGLKRLKALEGQRVLLLPNHPSYEDPYVMFEFSRLMGKPFNYVAAREVFNFANGVQGWVFQHCGVYSVIRGKADRESFKMTRQKLAVGERPLVIFIEGEVSYENDTLIPFESGVIQLAFWSMEDVIKQARKENPKKLDDPPPLHAVPVAMKYFYHEGWELAVEIALSRLETEVGLPHAHGESHYKRIRDIGNEILAVHEKNLGIKTREGQTFDERITEIKRLLLVKMEAFFQIPTDENVFALDRVRVIRNRLDEMVYSFVDDSDLTPYEHRMVEHLRQTFEEFYKDLGRVVNFLIYKEGYLTPDAGPERTIEFIRRLEKEVFGREQIHHPRTVAVQVGEPINLKNRYGQYLQNKKETTGAVAAEVEQSIRGMLASAKNPVR